MRSLTTRLLMALICCAISFNTWSQNMVTFNVDMSCSGETFSTVYLTGPSLGWCADCVPLSDPDMDDVWTVTMDLPNGNFEYKYQVDQWASQENLVDDMQGGASCAPITDYSGYANRNPSIAGDTAIFDTYGSCDTCSGVLDTIGCTDMTAANYDPNATVDDGSCQYDITFELDMNCYSGSFTTPYVVGPWNGWCGGCNPLSDQGNGIYSATYQFPVDTFEYKFQLDEWADQEDLVDDMNAGASCAPVTDFSTYANRTHGVTGVATLYANYGSCDSCDTATDTIGCTDAGAANYNPNATFDDGSCVYDVTFELDLSCYGGSFTTPFVAGPFNSWCGGCHPLADQGSGIYSATYQFPADSLEYKYQLDEWAFQEDLVDDVVGGAGSCVGVTDSATFANRLHMVTAAVTLTDTYDTCGTCPAAIDGCTDANAANYNPSATNDDGSCVYDITFSVDMSCAPVSFTTPYVTGPFTGWCGNCFPLADGDGDDIWEATYQFPAGALEYKYEVDDWAHQEDLVDDAQGGGLCAPVTDFATYANRQHMVSDAATLNDTYDTCGTCPAVVDTIGCTDPNAANYSADATVDDGSCMYDVTFSLDMNCYGGGFTTPYVSGPFNSWCADCHPLSSLGNGVYEGTYQFPADTLEYKYQLDQWNTQENLVDDMVGGASCAPVTDFSTFANRQHIVTDAVTLTDTYDTCGTCPGSYGCTDMTASNYNSMAIYDDGSCTYNVTFQVDMSAFEIPGEIYITGADIDGWCGQCILMEDLDNDSVFTVTLELEPGTYQYKYTNDTVANQENFATGMSCTVTEFGFTNRVVTVGAADTTLPAYCFSTCDVGCDTATFPVDVTFQVDMSNQDVVPGNVYITGNDFDGWCGTCIAMDDSDNDSVYQFTMTLMPGTYEYKYNNNDWSGTETLVPNSGCVVTNGSFTNRVVTVGQSDMVLPPYCFGTCDTTCENSVPPVNVTFKVDMSNETVAGDVFITGAEIDGWCGTCVPMVDTTGDDIYEVTLLLFPGTYQWKYNNTDWNGTENLVSGSSCTFTDSVFVNRIATITTDTCIGPVCFGACSPECPPAIDNMPADVVANTAPGTCEAVVTWTPPTTDGDSLIVSHASGSSFESGTTTVTYRSWFFAGGDTAVSSFDVTVIDNENPSITCPSNDYVSCSPVDAYPWGTADNCESVRVIGSPPIGTMINIGSQVVTLQAMDRAGNVDSCTFTVTVTGLPTADAGVDTAIVNGNSTSIGGSPTATGGSAPYTYLWFDLNGVANPAATANPSVSPATSTSYIVYVIDTNNCAGSDQVNVTVTNPFASCERPSNISVNNNSANSVTLNWNTVPGADMYQLQYRAQTGDRTVNTAVTANTSKTLNDLTENVIYQYRLKANCDAGAVSAWKFGSFTTHVFRMGESGIFDDVSFYPNPVSDKLNIAITTTSPIVEKLNIEMFNVLGQKVEDMTGQISGGFNYQVDVNKQPAGQYLVKVSIGDRVFNETIIIE